MHVFNYAMMKTAMTMMMMMISQYIYEFCYRKQKIMNTFSSSQLQLEKCACHIIIIYNKSALPVAHLLFALDY